jgi:hypothetical protein
MSRQWQDRRESPDGQVSRFEGHPRASRDRGPAVASVVPVTTEQIEKPGASAQVSLVDDINTRPDDVLRFLVGVVNDSKDTEFSVGVTLHVSGTIVCGVLISYVTYWEAIRASLRDTGSPVAQAFGDAFTAAILGTEIDPGADQSDSAAEGEEATPPLPSHIHLRDAVVWAPGVKPTLAKTLWRGRLSHVSAWSIGTFES